MPTPGVKTITEPETHEGPVTTQQIQGACALLTPFLQRIRKSDLPTEVLVAAVGAEEHILRLHIACMRADLAKSNEQPLS